jgi:acetyl-CoA synthetase
MHFDSEPDARPRGRIHTHEAAVLQRVSGHYAVDLHPGDIYYPAIEPGSLLWTAYAIIAPLTNRVTVVLDRAEFSPARCYQTIAAERVNVFLASAESVRKLVRAGHGPAAELDLSALRLPACPEATLPPEAVTFCEEVFGRPLHASLFEPEFGAIVIAEFLALPVQPGSIGKPLPGVQAALARSRDRRLERVRQGQGELVLRLLPDGKLTGHDDGQVLPTHGEGRWFATGRQAWCDADGNFYLTPD